MQKLLKQAEDADKWLQELKTPKKSESPDKQSFET